MLLPYIIELSSVVIPILLMIGIIVKGIIDETN